MRKRSKIAKRLRGNPPNRSDLEAILESLEEGLRASHLTELNREEEMAVQAIKTNSKYFFKYARAKSEIRAAIGPLRRGDELVGDPSQMSEMLKTQYESAFSSPLSTSDLHIDAGSRDHNNELGEIPFGPEDFVDMAANLKSSSAPGPNGVTALLIKKTIGVLSIPLNLI